MIQRMSYSTYRKLPKVYDESHTALFRQMENGDILKLKATFCKDALLALSKKKIEHAVFPKKLYRVYHITEGLEETKGIAYTQDYFPNMKTLALLEEVEKEYSDRELLKYFLNLLKTLKELHENSIAHGDITFSNIIMDKNLDYRYIDFDYAFVNNIPGIMKDCSESIPYLSYCNKETLYYLYSEKDVFRYLDKANLINMFCYFLEFGKVPEKRILSPFSKLKDLEFSSSIEKKFERMLIGNTKIEEDEYLLDVLDTLIQTDYKLPFRKRK